MTTLSLSAPDEDEARWDGEAETARGYERRTILGWAQDFFVKNFAAFAIGDFSGVDDAGAVFQADDDAVDEDENGQREIKIEERLWAGELEDFAVLV